MGGEDLETDKILLLCEWVPSQNTCFNSHILWSTSIQVGNEVRVRTQSKKWRNVSSQYMESIYGIFKDIIPRAYFQVQSISPFWPYLGLRIIFLKKIFVVLRARCHSNRNAQPAKAKLFFTSQPWKLHCLDDDSALKHEQRITWEGYLRLVSCWLSKKVLFHVVTRQWLIYGKSGFARWLVFSLWNWHVMSICLLLWD